VGFASPRAFVRLGTKARGKSEIADAERSHREKIVGKPRADKILYATRAQNIVGRCVQQRVGSDRRAREA